MKFAQSSMVYFNFTLEYAIRDLASRGYDGIEIWGGRPHMYRNDLDEELPGLRVALEETGMKVCNFIPAQFRYPSLLCSLNEQVRRDSVEYIRSAMDNAVAMGSPSISLCPGMLPWDQDIAQGWQSLARSLREIHSLNQEKGLALLIEPAHRFETNLLLTVDDTLRMIDEIDLDGFGVLMDTGHCNVNGEDFEAAVSACEDIPFHVHIDDNNGDMDAHLVPGEGNVDFAALERALSAIGYDGFVSAELGQKYVMDPGAACDRAMSELKRIFF